MALRFPQKRRGWLFKMPLEQLADHYRHCADWLHENRPIEMGDPKRLYAEMVLAIGKHQFRERFLPAARGAGYRAEAAAASAGPGESYDRESA